MIYKVPSNLNHSMILWFYEVKVEHIFNLSPSPDNLYENTYTHMYLFLIADIVRGEFTAWLFFPEKVQNFSETNE